MLEKARRHPMEEARKLFRGKTGIVKRDLGGVCVDKSPGE